jgi:histidine triad (HIT) family protein
MKDCLFCKIAEGTIPCEKVYEDELVLAFKDINPAAPVHILIIPKKHIDSLNAVDDSHSAILAHILITAKNLAKDSGIAENGYRLVNNCGDHGGQTVKHIHFHLLGGRSLNWPPG